MIICVLGFANSNKFFFCNFLQKVNFFQNLDIGRGVGCWMGKTINYEIARHLEKAESWGIRETLRYTSLLLLKHICVQEL